MHFDIIWSNGNQECIVDNSDFSIVSASNPSSVSCDIQIHKADTVTSTQCYDIQQSYDLKLNITDYFGEDFTGEACVKVDGEGMLKQEIISGPDIRMPLHFDSVGDVKIEVYSSRTIKVGFGLSTVCSGPKLCDDVSLTVKNACNPDEEESGLGLQTKRFDLCSQIPGNDLEGSPKDKCIKCQAKEGIWTAVGCIQHDGTSIVQAFIKIGLSVAGGAAVIMIMVSGLMFSVSRGDQKRTTEAKEMLTSAVIGLLFIIFSVTILQFIGVSLLQIPGFGG